MHKPFKVVKISPDGTRLTLQAYATEHEAVKRMQALNRKAWAMAKEGAESPDYAVEADKA